jgi:hypothetical protein
MIPTHGTEHEKRLEQVTCGELERNDPALRALLEECPECRDRMGGLESVSALLERAARDQREVLDSLDLTQAAPGSDVVGPFLRARLAERGRKRWLGYAAAAAVIASAGGAWWMMTRTGPTRPDPVLLGSSGAKTPGAQGDVLPFGPVEWELALPAGGYYEVELRNAHGISLAPTERLQQSVWIPSPEEEETLPDEFDVHVTAYDMYDQYVGSVTLSVARSR